MTTRRRPTFRELLRPGVAAVRANWRPFILLQLVAFAVVVSYYQIAFVRDVLDRLDEFRNATGFVFASAASAFAGAILPELAKALSQPGYKPAGRGGEVTFLVIFFAINGIIVDLFYRSLSFVVGEGTGFGTAFVKMLIDMLGFTPMFVLPIILLVFAWRRHGYRVKPVGREIAADGPTSWYLSRVVPMLLPNWAFWTPMVLLIYSMPPGLQIVMFAGALSAWSLVMVFIGNAEPVEAVTPPASPPSPAAAA